MPSKLPRTKEMNAKYTNPDNDLVAWTSSDPCGFTGEASILTYRLDELVGTKLRALCLFGLHLLGPETETVAIVEAEKTAVVTSMFFPDVLFLATGGITNLRKET